jgi:hypothetical protein
VDYRLYLLSPDGRISGVIEMDCTDDEHAVQTVKDRNLTVSAELWQMKRKVAFIEPERP